MHEQTVNPGLIAAFIIASIVFILVTFVVIKPVIVYLQQMKTNIIGNAYKTLVKKNDTYSINCYHWIQTELSFFRPMVRYNLHYFKRLGSCQLVLL